VLDVVGAEPGDPCERLRVEEDKRGGHAVLELDVVAVRELSQQREPLVLGNRRGVTRRAVRNGDGGHVLGPHCPAEESVSKTPGGVAACVPGVDIGLGAVGESVSALGAVVVHGQWSCHEPHLILRQIPLRLGEKLNLTVRYYLTVR
jgi:hypothetical protein